MRLSTICENTSWSRKIVEVFKSHKFQDWLCGFGVHGTLSSLKQGSVFNQHPGCVYSIGNFIIKFTSDINEVKICSFLSNNPSRFTARVYSCVPAFVFMLPERVRAGKLVSFEPEKFYMVLSEKVNTNIGAKLRTAGSAIFEFSHANPELYRELMVSNHDSVIEKSGVESNCIKAARFILTSIYGFYSETGILINDPHGRNLALKDGKIVFFDFGNCDISDFL